MTVSRAAPTDTKVWVRSPAILPERSRSNPTKAPRAVAIKSRFIIGQSQPKTQFIIISIKEIFNLLQSTLKDIFLCFGENKFEFFFAFRWDIVDVLFVLDGSDNKK